MNFFRRFRFPYIGTGPILVSVVITAAIVAASWSSIRGVENFPDPVASLISWNDVYKHKDIKVVELSLALVVGFSVFTALLCQCIANDREEMQRSLNELLLVSLIPAAWRFAIASSMPVDDPPPFRYVAAFPIISLVAIAVMTRYRAALRPNQVLIIGGGILLTMLLSIYAGVALPLSIARLIPRTTKHLLGTAPTFAMISAFASAIAIFTVWFLSASADLFETRVLKILNWIQYPLPLLFFFMVPPQLEDALNRFANPYPARLMIALSLCCLVAWFFMWRRFGSKREGYSLALAIAPVSVAAVLIVTYCGAAGLPIPSRDYFHWGEQAVPWQQWWDFGKRPYVDFVPVHGLMPFLRGAFNQFFFDGTLASYNSADVLLTGLATVALGLAASLLLTPLGALFFLLGSLPFLDRMYFLAPAMFVVASPSLMKKPARLLCIWIVVCLLMVGYNPTIGPAFAFGTIPLGLWLVYRLCRENPRALGIIVLVLAAVAAIILKIAALRLFEIQFVHFIVDNAWTNEIAHGIAFDEGLNQRDSKTGMGSTQFLWEIGRIAWALVSVFAAGIFWQEFKREPALRRRSLMVLAGCTPFVMLLTVPWIFGRIDSGAFGRSGGLARAAVYAVLPALVMLYVSRERLIGALLITAAIVGYFYPSNPSSCDLPILFAESVSTRVVPPGSVMVDGKQIGLPRLGQVIQPTPNFLPEVVGLKKTLTEFLRPGETYFDTTNQTALYFYLDLPSPVRYTMFVAANSRLQSGELQQLQERPVHTVMIGPAGWLDGAPFSLRNYEIYRKFTCEMVAVQRDQWVFLVDPKRFPSVGPIGSEDQLVLLDSVFRRINLLRLPVTWGQSFNNMKIRFDHVAAISTKETTFTHDLQVQPDGRFKFTGPTPYWEYHIPAEVKDGTTADFVRFSLAEELTDPVGAKFVMKNSAKELPNSVEPQMSCRWVTADGVYSPPIDFKVRAGNILIPLGAYPRWLLGKHPMTFRLDFTNPESVKWAKILDIDFLHLKRL